MFVEVVFPLPFRKAFTYSVPDEMRKNMSIGKRVVAPFGNRILTGFVINVSKVHKVEGKIKSIRDVLDDTSIFEKESLKFYEWISEYYLCSLGEVLKNSIPYGLDVESKRKLVSDPERCRELLTKVKKKSPARIRILEFLIKKTDVRISEIQKYVGKKSIYSILNTLQSQGAVTIYQAITEPKVRIKKLLHVRLNKSIDEIYAMFPVLETKSPKQLLILMELLSERLKSSLLSELLKKTGSSRSTVQSLEKKGLVEVFEQEVERVHVETYREDLPKIKLTEEQQAIVDKISSKINKKEFSPYLLHGVTGSGKTQIYIELTKVALAAKKDVIILVPEISLTPQITARFYNNFGNVVNILHSRMSLGERYDSWRGIVSGKYHVIIGPRSALFAPLKNIGMIVVDEEHDPSYKQYDLVPRYNARDSALIRGKLGDFPVILGSATPSVESMYNSKTGKYELLSIENRVDGAKMPIIKLINVNIEKNKGRMENVFSKTLLEAISSRISKKEGVIILQNRRGFSTQVYCEDCGELETCSECSVTLVHHIDRNVLQCHYCGKIKALPKSCSNCGSIALKYFGTGTQRVEDELEYYFPDIKIERVDSDSMSKKGKLGTVMNAFRKGEIQVLVGTQMVSKGLDFSHVTLVGVISAETSLWLPDFRADERTIQLLTQVSGRSGRSKKEGEVLIQTQDHRHFVLQKVLLNDYAGFYEREIRLRELNGYPPFSRLGLIEFKHKDEKRVSRAAEDFYKLLKPNRTRLQISVPNPAVLARIKGEYRYHILIKSPRAIDPGGKLLREKILETFILFNQKSLGRDVKINFDIDPQSVT